MADGGDSLKDEARALKARLAAELKRKAELDAAPPSASEDVDPEDWGRTESDDALLASLHDEDSEVDDEAMSLLASASDEWGWPEDDDVPIPKAAAAPPAPAPAASPVAWAMPGAHQEAPPLGAAGGAPRAAAAGPGAPAAPAAAPQQRPAPAAAQAPPPPPPGDAAQTAGAQATAALRRELTNQTRHMTVDALAQRGVRNVQVMGLSTIERIVARAVANAVERGAVVRSLAERRQLEEEANREFMTLLRRHKALLAQKSEGDRRHDELTAELTRLRAEMDDAEDALKQERRGSGPTLDADAVAQLAETFQALLQAFMSDERRNDLVAESPTALQGLTELEQKMGEVFDRLLDRVKSNTEELLERRITKLNNALEETEAHLRALAKAKSIDGGVASIYDSVQGLSLDAADYERKKDLLAIVFVENLQLQEREVTEEDRKALADAVSALGTQQRGLEPSLELPAGFMAPLETPTTDVAF